MLVYLVTKWLPIIFGCHCLPERSFFVNGKQLPLCARCTGELIGFIVAILSFFWKIPTIPVLIGLLFPLILDGSIQLLTPYRSTNLKRMISGVLFGYALFTLFIISAKKILEIGIDIGSNLRN